MKVVINTRFGGFSLSRAAIEKAREISNNPKWGGPCIKGDKWDESGEEVDYDFGTPEVTRHDAVMIEAIEILGVEASSGSLARLKIVEIPDGVNYYIDDYDGQEHIAEVHRTWA